MKLTESKVKTHIRRIDTRLAIASKPERTQVREDLRAEHNAVDTL